LSKPLAESAVVEPIETTHHTAIEPRAVLELVALRCLSQSKPLAEPAVIESIETTHHTAIEPRAVVLAVVEPRAVVELVETT
jgi:hypothetical protein